MFVSTLGARWVVTVRIGIKLSRQQLDGLGSFVLYQQTSIYLCKQIAYLNLIIQYSGWYALQLINF